MNPLASTRKEREFARREREILDIALVLFNRDDWQSVTVEQIAREAGIAKGTVYKHFDSKDEIYARLALEFYGQVLARMREVDPSLPVLDRIRSMIRAMWDCHMEQREYARVVNYCRRDDFRRCVKPETAEAFTELDREFNEVGFGPLEEGIEQGLFPRKPLPELVFGAAAAINGAILLAWMDCPMDLPQDRYLEEITRFILAGLVYQDHPLRGPRHTDTAAPGNAG